MRRALVPSLALLILLAALPAVPAADNGCVRAPAQGLTIRIASAGEAGFAPGCVRLVGTGRIVFTNADATSVVSVVGPCFVTGHLEPGEAATIHFQRDAAGALFARDPFALTPCAPDGEPVELAYEDTLHEGRAGVVIVEIALG